MSFVICRSWLAAAFPVFCDLVICLWLEDWAAIKPTVSFITDQPHGQIR